MLNSVEVHEFDTQINDLQFSPDRTYFITAGKDKSAKVIPLTRTLTMR
jgi:translation initiation factor 3 subunit I